MLEISSSKNSIIKEIKSLSRKKNRWKEKLFIIEGIKLIEEALNNFVPIKYILFSEMLLRVDSGEDFFMQIKNKKQTIKISETLFKQISDLENPQGVLAVVEFDEKRIEEIYKKENPLIIFLDRLNDPGNLGTIIRSADAFNIDAIVLGVGSVDPYNSKVVRSTMGSIFRVPIYNIKNNEIFFNDVKKRNIDIITTSLNGKRLSKKDLSSSAIIVIGNEANGVKNDIIELATKAVKIPMPGKAESLNAGVAASIIMYEGMRSRN
ncbi:MAG: TrmH family RNA methyltransferase [Tissierella sp.]|uniref:TrmH family RNA methyltransferase n=1 Tax=Tissierella sp. TaxID=41274 RepID=UPI003F9C956C